MELPAFVLTLVGIIIFLILLFFVFMPSFFSTACGSHTIGYQYVCRLLGYGW